MLKYDHQNGLQMWLPKFFLNSPIYLTCHRIPEELLKNKFKIRQDIYTYVVTQNKITLRKSLWFFYLRPKYSTTESTRHR